MERLNMNGESWKIVNDQYYEQVTTTYKCNTMSLVQSSMLHITLFFPSTLCFSHFFLFILMPVAYSSTLYSSLLIGLGPYIFFFLSFSWPLAIFPFFSSLVALGHNFFFYSCSMLLQDTTIQY